MKKWLCIILCIVSVLFTFTMPAFADNTEPEKIDISKYVTYDESGSVTNPSSSQFLVSYEKLDAPESIVVNIKKFIISGTSKGENVRIELYRYNKDEKAYQSFLTSSEKSMWDLALTDELFTEDILLKDGSNRILLVAYKKDETDNLEEGINLQINAFKIDLKQSFFDKVINVFEGIFNK